MMVRGLIAGGLCLFAFAVILDSQVGGGEKDKVTIKLVMQKCMDKDGPGLCKKVASGKADADEKKQLIQYFTALNKLTPPKGDLEDWKTKTQALIDAAKADDGKALAKAANCAACHSVHKGKKK
jgi:cytochrome c